MHLLSSSCVLYVSFFLHSTCSPVHRPSCIAQFDDTEAMNFKLIIIHTSTILSWFECYDFRLSVAACRRRTKLSVVSMVIRSGVVPPGFILSPYQSIALNI